MIIDIWSDDEEEIKENKIVEKAEKSIQKTTIEGFKHLDLVDGRITVINKDKTLYLSNKTSLTEHNDYESLYKIEEEYNDGQYNYTLPLTPSNAFVLKHILKSYKMHIMKTTVSLLGETSRAAIAPTATINNDNNKKFINVTVPNIRFYKNLLKKVNAIPNSQDRDVWKVRIDRIMDLQDLYNISETSLPEIKLDDNVYNLINKPIEGFDGSIESLANIPTTVLNAVQVQNNSHNKRSKTKQKPFEEKLASFGINNLYDLMLFMPRRYIDKTNPQDIRDLVIDEPATIIGKIIDAEDLMGRGRNNFPTNMGVKFTIELGSGRTIIVSFWNQKWLKAKYRIGEEVLVTGKFKIWNKQPQLNGTSIEYSDEAVMLPIVPVYKQSESKGITTGFLVTAIRELFSRLGDIELPKYLQNNDRLNYSDVYKELHFPTTLDYNKKVIDTLAYYELLHMQLLIQMTKEHNALKEGISQKQTERNLQNKAIEALPFTLTDGQQKAVKTLNKKLGENTPSSILLNADVGAGKSVISQLACLRAVEAGYQAVLLGPTDVLARQLYNTFERLIKPLNDNGEDIKICFLGGGLKAAEKKKILKEIADGEVDVIIGTHSVVSKTTKYNNLGFIVIDEQQKFGAEQRSVLLNSSREDNKIPDLLMQSATPIPRSTAQVFYGDIDMILLTDKPAGRLPIETEWIEEDPNEITSQLINPVWNDIMEEADKGNQTFVITPLVKDSEKVDAASAERTYKDLKDNVLSNLNVGLVHGQMKPDEQRVVMQDFRDKKYDVLVASTVVEVGVDIPDATRVVVLSADRLGASSLHQIRGRAGRNDKPSKCYLVSLGKTENSAARLQSLVDNSDGFNVAKSDLSLRGEGTVFGSTQSGASDMIFASLSKHSKWIPEAKKESLDILHSENRDAAIKVAEHYFDIEKRLK